MSLIAFDHISKSYGGKVTAVADLQLSIDAGEFMTFLGPSGSGKTTTLMMLAGFEKPTSGSILYDGRPIEKLPPWERDMGVVFQSYSLFPHMTVAQNVAFPLEMRKTGREEIRRRVSAALDKVRLFHHADRRPMQLSGGEQQRVAIARALVFDPKLVLLDEPLSALDKNLREELQLEIRRLHREVGVTMVFVTHDQSEAMTLSDRIAVFNRGRIEQLGPPEQLYDSPANAFVAGFIGDNNRVSGTVVSVDGAEATLKAGDRMFRGRMHPGQFAVGAEAGLSVRPEAVRLDQSPTDTPANRLTACVIDIIHQGDHFRILVRPDLGGAETAPWMIKLQPMQKPEALTVGGTVTIGFRPEAAWIL
ncbi:Fe3+/spermidine/putrescine ABC transporter ATP-binding protein [Mesorhizobium loti]|nr:ABC transporter ATP-binding protein [Mesorhizobium loti]PLP59025.1 Fe3+/spermidine/putrescine ABC transporter ATP-binding protein [Mesorhizobium loti]